MKKTLIKIVGLLLIALGAWFFDNRKMTEKQFWINCVIIVGIGIFIAFVIALSI